MDGATTKKQRGRGRPFTRPCAFKYLGKHRITSTGVARYQRICRPRRRAREASSESHSDSDGGPNRILVSLRLSQPKSRPNADQRIRLRSCHVTKLEMKMKKAAEKFFASGLRKFWLKWQLHMMELRNAQAKALVKSGVCPSLTGALGMCRVAAGIQVTGGRGSNPAL